jgi:Surface glycan-binding protein B xyloglucan binding domain
MMKSIIKTSTRALTNTLLFGALLTSILFQACQKDESLVGTPVISYVRITDPLKSDSLVTHAFMGSSIAIIGQNLQNVDEIWFNNQKAFVNFSFVTNTSIIVTVPNVIPSVVTNKMLLINSNKIDTLKYTFGVDVPSPFLSGMLCEYVDDGSTAVIQGNFFIDDPAIPLKVFFPGNLEAKVTDITLTQIKVTVPTGAGVGPIQVKSLYGSTRSSFYFRDDRNLILDFDALTAAGGWRSGVTGNSNPAPVSGNYVRFKGTMLGKAGATWDEDHFSFNFWPSSNGRPNVPLYTGDIANAAIKFECYVVDTWSASALQMIFTPYSTANTNSYIADGGVPRGLWIPWKESGTYKTEGWTTVSVPLAEFKYKADGGLCANTINADMLRGLTFFVFSGGMAGTDCTPQICIDNIRIVPIK